jgi:hypothetical protein
MVKQLLHLLAEEWQLALSNEWKKPKLPTVQHQHIIHNNVPDKFVN